MPKVSEEHKERRRAEIVEGARRAFARYGYEGATVARLEEEIGLSRGAIFNYFDSKEHLFVEAAAELSDRMVRILLEQGLRPVLEAILHEDRDWLAVLLEATRRVRTDPELKARVERHEAARAAGRGAVREALSKQGYRDDVPIEAIAFFLSVVANGLALYVTGDEEPPADVDTLVELVRHGVSRRA